MLRHLLRALRSAAPTATLSCVVLAQHLGRSCASVGAVEALLTSSAVGVGVSKFLLLHLLLMHGERAIMDGLWATSLIQ